MIQGQKPTLSMYKRGKPAYLLTLDKGLQRLLVEADTVYSLRGIITKKNTCVNNSDLCMSYGKEEAKLNQSYKFNIKCNQMSIIQKCLILVPTSNMIVKVLWMDV